MEILSHIANGPGRFPRETVLAMLEGERESVCVSLCMYEYASTWLMNAGKT